jgi:hypothetical protein
MITATKRMGRPTKPARKGRRYQIGVIVTGATKAVIDAAAKASGRTISREVEHLVEKALQYDRVLEAMNRSLADIANGNVDAAHRRAGYRWVHSNYGKVWFPPGYPIEKSGFIPPEEEQL